MYGKLFQTAFTGTLFGSGPTVFAVWAYVIANAEEARVELNPKLLASCIGTDTQDIQSAIAFLCRPDPESRNPDEDGRRLIHWAGMQYHVTSWQHYRDLRNAEERREYMRNYMRDRRAGELTEATEVNSKQKLAPLAKSVSVPVPVPVPVSVSVSKKEKVKGVVATQALPEWLPADRWEAFKQHRKSLKKALTDEAQRLLIAKLDRLRLQGHEPTELLNEAIANGWQGIYLPTRGEKKAGIDKSLAQAARVRALLDKGVINA